MNLLKNVLLFSLIIALYGCVMQNESKKSKLDDDSLKVSIHTFTRGVSRTIYVKPKSLIAYEFDNEIASYELSNAQWDKISHLVEAIDVNKLEDIQVPSHGYATDSGLAEDISIHLGEEVYKSPTYDEKNPPSEIKDLITYIKHLKKQ